MRPTFVDTPPASHVMAQIIQPTPILMCGLDWKNLTDYSFQILDSSEFMQDESMCLNNYVTNHIQLVDTIVSPTLDDTNHSFYEQDLQETRLSVESMSHEQGERESRIIFTPTGCSKNGRFSNKADDKTDRKLELEQQFKRARYSDSDIANQYGRGTPRRQANVARSKSVSWAESVKENGDFCLVKPLKPCAYETKISGVKRIPSFRSITKPEASRSTRQEDIKGLNESVTSTEGKYRISDSQHGLVSQGSKFKIARLVRNGLKSVKKSNETLRKVGQTEQFYNQELKKQQRGIRYSSALGGLSEFLRKLERRKTLSDIPELSHGEVILSKFIESGSNTKAKRIQMSDDSSSDTSDVKPKKTPSLVEAHERLVSTGTSNLKFAQCQRKLSFNEDLDLSESTLNAEERGLNTDTAVFNDSKTTVRRPRLGIISSGKHSSVMPIDSLEMDIVIDLKRRIENKARSTRIKTNGSLKPRSILPQATISHSPIWRKSFRNRRVNGTRPLRMQRESIV